MYIKTGIRNRASGFRNSQSAFRNQQSAFRTPQSGISLIELIISIVIISAALAGILMVMNVTTKGSADPLVRKQAMAAAYSLLEEIELQDFSQASGVTGTVVTQANRASVYHVIGDYDNFATSGVFSLADATSVSAVLPSYNASVSVVPVALSSVPALYSIAAGSAVQINVTVSTSDNRESITATGYRTAY